MLNYITWDISPILITIGNYELRWYSFLITGGFFLGYFILGKLFKDEGVSEKDFSVFARYLFFSTIIGLRLGHCLFYDPVFYLSNPLEILKIWEGGLASHGAALGILIGLLIYVIKYKKSFIWILDRVVIIVCIVGSLVRVGNLMNSEIIGSPTNFKGAFLFVNSIDKYLVKPNPTVIDDSRITAVNKDTLVEGIPYTKMLLEVDFKKGIDKDYIEKNVTDKFQQILESRKSLRTNIKFFDKPQIQLKPNKNYYTAVLYVWAIPRFPSQMYEAIFYASLFVILILLYNRNRNNLMGGLFFSSFLIALFVFRFFIEFIKKEQVEFESNMLLNMGQVLSIPFILAGISLLVYSLKKKRILNFSKNEKK